MIPGEDKPRTFIAKTPKRFIDLQKKLKQMYNKKEL